MIFAPQVHSAILDEAKRTTLKDVQPVFFTFLKVVVGVYILSTGNLIIMGLAFYMYRRSQAEAVKISAKVAAAAGAPTA
jgi:hypothetical protein